MILESLHSLSKPSWFLILSVTILAVLYFSFQFLFAKIYAKSLATQTRINEARRMGEMPKKKRDQTCVVLGAGVSGSLNAAIASRHFERVIIVDPHGSTSDPKSFIPQVDQLHGITPMTTFACQSIWPEFDSVYKKFGGRLTFAARDAYEFFVCGGPIRWKGKSPGYLSKSPAPGMSVTRRTFHNILQELLQLHTPSTTVIIGRAVDARFSSNTDQHNVEAIQIQHGQDGSCEWIECDLLIDSSGGQRVFRQLIAKDHLQRFKEPKREKYNLQVIYSTTTFVLHPKVLDQLPLPDIMGPIPENLRKNTIGSILLINTAFTSVDRFFMISRQDGEKVALCCVSFEAEERINSLDGFQEAVQACHHVMYDREIDPWFERFMDLMRENEEIQEEKVKFHRLDDRESYIHDLNSTVLPSNLLLMGDSYTKLNPAFAQGMQKASGEAMTLHSALLDHSNGDKTEESIVSVVKAFNLSRNIWLQGLFKMNRALDLDREPIKARNPQLSQSVGQSERKFFRGLFTYIGRTQDSELGTLFWSVVFVGTVAPAMFLHPYYLFRILYGMYCM